MKNLLGVIIAFILLGCNQPPSDNTEIRLQQQWYANSGFAGEIWAKEYSTQKYNVGLEVIPGGSEIVTVQSIMSGQADFGVAGADQVIQANQNGADLVVVGVINYRSLAAFISKQDRKILTPNDLVGKKIGTMEGTPVHLVYKVLLDVNGIADKSVAEVPTNWTYAGFLSDDYDVYPAFVNDEPVTLEQEGINVSVIRPHNYGVSFIGTVYFCRRDLVENEPEKVQMFVNLMIDGWKGALSNPSKSIDILMDYDKTLNREKELKSLKVGLDYYRGQNDRILYADKALWEKMAGQLTNAGLIESFDYEKTVNNSFVNWYHLHDK